MKTFKIIIYIVSIILYTINMVIAIDKKNISAINGWLCALIMSITLLINNLNEPE